MFLVDYIILYASILVLVAISLRKVSSRFGMPVLVLFLLVGMLAGSEGIGGIVFENYEFAHAVSALALAVILFDGGLRTQRERLAATWKPALTLATVGVVLTAVITGLAASWILRIPVPEGILIGSIIGSTDAAAVFSILRSKGVNLDDRISATLEIESGSNDPMAIFLTIGMIELVLGERSGGVGMIVLFVRQMGIGLVAGYLLGRLSVILVNRIHLDSAGLYPVLVITLGLLTYGVTSVAGGSGFLAVFVAGIVIGNRAIVFQRGTLVFHDGMAWLSQIVMFLILGLLSFPSQLIRAADEGLMVAAVLTFVARPIAVILLLLPFRFKPREVTFISWVGLKGAVPIILGIYPLLFGVPGGIEYFNIVFFAVLISAVAQGWSLPQVARMLGLQRPVKSVPPATLDITSLRHVNADIVDYEIREESAAAHLRISELSLPEEVVIAMVTHGEEIIPARGPTVLLPGDHVFVILRPEARDAVDEVFSSTVEREVPLRAGILVPSTITIETLEQLYGVSIDSESSHTIGEFMVTHLASPLREGSFVELDGVRLFVHTQLPDGTFTIGIEASDSGTAA